MHSRSKFILVVSGLVAAGLVGCRPSIQVGSRHGEGGPARRSITILRRHSGDSPPPKVILQESFVAWGPSAEEEALRQAHDWLIERAKLEGTTLPLEYLTRNRLVHEVDPTAEDRSWAHKLGKDTKVVRVQLEVTREQAEDLDKVAREERMEPRHLLLARILAGMVAMILVLGGYLRLEEATRGYYTLLLRAAAVLVLVAVGAGLYLSLYWPV